jgi:plastocyanin domain-containing protein
MLNKLNKKILWVCLACLVLLTSSPATAEMSSSHSQHNSQFQIIEQPLGVKVGVIIAGFGLIGLELWWFIFSKSEVRR